MGHSRRRYVVRHEHAGGFARGMSFGCGCVLAVIILGLASIGGILLLAVSGV